MADHPGITREMVGYYERRAGNPSLAFIERAADVCGVSAADLPGAPVSPTRAKPGPVSRLDQCIERIRQLPRKEQEFVLKFLDTVLDRAKAS